LYFLCAVYDVKWTDFFEVLSVLAALLTLLLPRPKPTMQPASSGPLAMAVIMRWMIIVALLLAIGYVTQYSEDFSRRVVVTWIIVTPAALIGVTLALHEASRRLMVDPEMRRTVAFVGCNDASMSLARGISSGSSSLAMSVVGFFDD